ncbi:hypothetical protein [Paraburkholderia sp. GAS42]|jgi:hypothetical protein|uniref:hypothetical protein n=1 Tax=Paraburkholderia sp. GAS42 TaxID=3035135 RepID=UPI003D22B93F
MDVITKTRVFALRLFNHSGAVMAQTDAGPTMFIVDTDTPGYRMVRVMSTTHRRPERPPACMARISAR